MSDWRRLDGPLAAWSLGDGERVVFCHGFTQTSVSWKPLAARFATGGYEAVVVDLPGHGASAGMRADLRRGADLLVRMLGRASYVGYSMGGRLVLQAALIYPHDVRRLAMIGATPGIADETERVRRIHHDDQLARRLRDVGVSAFVDEWTAQPLFGGLQLGSDDLEARRANTVEGLSSSLRLAGAGALVSAWSRLPELTMPTLVVAGERDVKFVDIGRQIARAVPHGRFVSIADAGHAAHLQRPDEVSDALRSWLRTSAP